MNKLIIAVIIIIIIIIIVAVVASMPMLPAGVSNGDNVTCPGTDKFYKIEGNKKRWYTWDGYVKAGQPALKHIDCGTLNKITEGATIS